VLSIGCHRVLVVEVFFFFEFAAFDIGIGNVFIFQSYGCVGLENDFFNSLRVYCLRFFNRVSRHGCDVTESFYR